MEPLRVNASPLVTKITHISNIVNYYSYMHNGAELFRRLGKKSRNEWNSNLEAISKVIMHNTTNRVTLQFENEFSYKMASVLLRKNNYGFYRLSLLLKSPESIDAMIWFLRKIKFYPCDLFKNIELEDTEGEFEKVSIFLQNFTEMGFDKESVKMPSYSRHADFVLDSIPNSFVYEYPHRLKIFVEFLKFSLEDLDPFHQRVKTLITSEHMESIEGVFLDQMQGNKLIIRELSSISDFKVIKCSNLSIDFDVLKTFVSLNYDSELKIEDGKSIKLRLYGSEDIVYDDMFLNFSKLLTFFPNVDKLAITDPINVADAIDKVFGVFQKEKEYLHLRQIKQLRFKGHIFGYSSINFRKYSGPFAILKDGNIKICEAKKLHFNASASQYLQFNDIVVVANKFKFLEIDGGVEVKQYNEAKLKKITQIFQAARSKDENYTFLILDTHLHDFKGVVFSFLNKYFDQMFCYSNCFEYILFTHEDSLKEGGLEFGKYCTDKYSSTSDSCLKSAPQLISELEDNALLSISIDKILSRRYVWKDIHSSNMKINHSNGIQIPDANSVIDLFSALKQKKLMKLEIDPEIGDKTVFDALKSLLSTNNGIQDLSVKLSRLEFVSEVFESMKNNYGISTLVLCTPDEVDERIIEQADQFSDKRIGLKIVLNTNQKTYIDTKKYQLRRYPEELFD